MPPIEDQRRASVTYARTSAFRSLITNSLLTPVPTCRPLPTSRPPGTGTRSDGKVSKKEGFAAVLDEGDAALDRASIFLNTQFAATQRSLATSPLA
jgi:hypothetical protein